MIQNLIQMEKTNISKCIYTLDQNFKRYQLILYRIAEVDPRFRLKISHCYCTPFYEYPTNYTTQ